MVELISSTVASCLCRIDYMAPGKSIAAKFESSKWNLKLGSGKNQVLIPARQKYLEIGFCPPMGRVHVLTGGLSKVMDNLETGRRDYIHFLNSLGRQGKFRDIQVVFGYTNPQLARLAVRKLGFHYDDHFIDIKRQLDNPNGYVPIYGIAEELLAKLPLLQDFQRRFKR